MYFLTHTLSLFLSLSVYLSLTHAHKHTHTHYTHTHTHAPTHTYAISCVFQKKISPHFVLVFASVCAAKILSHVVPAVGHHTYIFPHIFFNMSKDTYTCTYVCTYSHIRMNTLYVHKYIIHACIHTYIHSFIYKYIYNIHTYIHTYKHAFNKHTYIRPYIPAYKHTYKFTAKIPSHVVPAAERRGSGRAQVCLVTYFYVTWRRIHTWHTSLLSPQINYLGLAMLNEYVTYEYANRTLGVLWCVPWRIHTWHDVFICHIWMSQ